MCLATERKGRSSLVTIGWRQPIRSQYSQVIICYGSYNYKVAKRGLVPECRQTLPQIEAGDESQTTEVILYLHPFSSFTDIHTLSMWFTHGLAALKCPIIGILVAWAISAVDKLQQPVTERFRGHVHRCAEDHHSIYSKSTGKEGWLINVILSNNINSHIMPYTRYTVKPPITDPPKSGRSLYSGQSKSPPNDCHRKLTSESDPLWTPNDWLTSTNIWLPITDRAPTPPSRRGLIVLVARFRSQFNLSLVVTSWTWWPPIVMGSLKWTLVLPSQTVMLRSHSSEPRLSRSYLLSWKHVQESRWGDHSHQDQEAEEQPDLSLD